MGKSTTKKIAAKKSPAKKATARKPAAKKSPAKKAVAKKSRKPAKRNPLATAEKTLAVAARKVEKLKVLLNKAVAAYDKILARVNVLKAKVDAKVIRLAA